MKVKFMKGLAIGLLSLICACASNSKTAQPLMLTSTEEKILNLEEQLKTQETQISRLNQAIKRFQENGKFSRVKENKKGIKKFSKAETKQAYARAQKAIKTEKLYPPGSRPELAEKRPAPRDLFMEGETLADSSQSAMHFYYRGLQLLNEKKFEEALQSLRAFISQNPHHVYADRAQYLIADSHFQSKDYNLVVVATNLLEARYPYSVKLPEALYKRSLSFVELSQSDQARVTLRNLIQKFPNDPIVAAAQKKLVALK